MQVNSYFGLATALSGKVPRLTLSPLFCEIQLPNINLSPFLFFLHPSSCLFSITGHVS